MYSVHVAGAGDCVGLVKEDHDEFVWSAQWYGELAVGREGLLASDIRVLCRHTIKARKRTQTHRLCRLISYLMEPVKKNPVRRGRRASLMGTMVWRACE